MNHSEDKRSLSPYFSTVPPCRLQMFVTKKQLQKKTNPMLLVTFTNRGRSGKGLERKIVPPWVTPNTLPLSYDTHQQPSLFLALSSPLWNSSTHSLRTSHKGKQEGWLSVGVVAQWQSAGGLSQRPWVRLLAKPPIMRPLPFQRSSDSNSLDCVSD